MSSSAAIALQPGARLDAFEIKSVLGSGGFGVTYRAWDHTLACDVAIKEYLPSALARREADRLSVTTLTNAPDDRDDYEAGLERFLEEARTLARFNEPNLVSVRHFLRRNGTAYMIMDYEDGEGLDRYLRRNPPPRPQQEVRDWLDKLLDGLAAVHKQSILHRDIKPANIFLRRNGEPVLLDFGSARQQTIGESKDGLTSYVTLGYAPFEQYSRHGRQGPWTDLYALGATLYFAITGGRPSDGMDRYVALQSGGKDPFRPLGDNDGCGATLAAAVNWMLAVDAEARPQRVEDLKAALAQDNPRLMDPGSAPAPANAPDTLATTMVLETPEPAPAWNTETLDTARLRLAEHLGPVAKVVVRRAAADTKTLDELYQRLAEAIPDQTSRQAFLVEHNTGPATGSTGETRGWDAQILGKLETALAEHIGPMARIMVKQQAERTRDLKQLRTALAEHIESTKERKRFLKATQ